MDILSIGAAVQITGNAAANANAAADGARTAAQRANTAADEAERQAVTAQQASTSYTEMKQLASNEKVANDMAYLELYAEVRSLKTRLDSAEKKLSTLIK